MGLRVCFAIHPKRRLSAVFHGGDERGFVAVPEGWVEMNPLEILPDEAALERWIRLDLHDRLVGLTPPGFKAKRGLSPGWWRWW
jgi:hypothetical protein